jgi:hypothetical protein
MYDQGPRVGREDTTTRRHECARPLSIGMERGGEAGVRSVSFPEDFEPLGGWAAA